MLNVATAEGQRDILSTNDRVVAHIPIVYVSHIRDQCDKVVLPRIIAANFICRGHDNLVSGKKPNDCAAGVIKYLPEYATDRKHKCHKRNDLCLPVNSKTKETPD